MKKLAFSSQILIISACILLMLSFGLRASLGLFVTPISEHNNWGRDIISMALAIQNLAWGVVAVLAGGLADKFGNVKVVVGAAILYAVGLYCTTLAGSQWQLNQSTGFLVGAGIAGTSFGIIMPAMARAVPVERRQWALGLATAAGSFGQFAIVPFAQTLIDSLGWVSSLHVLSAIALLMMVLAIPLAPYSGSNDVNDQDTDQSIIGALREALSNKSYLLLSLGFFVCGFHIAFITVHFPGYLADLGFDANIAAWAIAVIGISNMIGSYCSGLLSAKWSKRDMLCSIYFLRGVVILLFMIVPATLNSVLIFSAALGFLWLATVPPTSGLVAMMFGTRYMALLYGFVFLSHQLGGFTGVFLGGYLYEQSEQFQIVTSFCGQYLGFNAYGDAARYNVVWLISIALAILATLAHWPIREQAVGRFAARQH